MGTTIAEYFRDQGKKVILMMDSVTRFARAQREIGLARGEPPARYGFPPSVFAELPCLFERCGNRVGKGTLTGFYTVLVEGDNLDEPVADETKSLIDGHIILSPRVGYRPSIELLMSESRVKGSLTTISAEVRDAAEKVHAFLVQYKKDEQDISFGFFEGGNQAAANKRKAEKRLVDDFMSQKQSEGIPLAETQAQLRKLADQLPDLRVGKGKP
jgi:type III secretion protein N (ATPase)